MFHKYLGREYTAAIAACQPRELPKSKLNQPRYHQSPCGYLSYKQYLKLKSHSGQSGGGLQFFRMNSLRRDRRGSGGMYVKRFAECTSLSVDMYKEYFCVRRRRGARAWADTGEGGQHFGQRRPSADAVGVDSDTSQLADRPTHQDGGAAQSIAQLDLT